MSAALDPEPALRASLERWLGKQDKKRDVQFFRASRPGAPEAFAVVYADGTNGDGLPEVIYHFNEYADGRGFEVVLAPKRGGKVYEEASNDLDDGPCWPVEVTVLAACWLTLAASSAIMTASSTKSTPDVVVFVLPLRSPRCGCRFWHSPGASVFGARSLGRRSARSPRRHRHASFTSSSRPHRPALRAGHHRGRRA